MVSTVALDPTTGHSVVFACPAPTIAMRQRAVWVDAKKKSRTPTRQAPGGFDPTRGTTRTTVRVSNEQPRATVRASDHDRNERKTR